jgi:enamine deaminase RidA (YjgF/YER057c/UK114 family)
VAQQVINLKGHGHPQDSPLGCKIGPLLSSGAITGKDLKTGIMPPDADTQARNAFINMKGVLAAAGMGLDDVAKLTIYLADEKHRDAAIKHWALTFPDPNRRPTRRTLLAPIHAGIVQVEIIAYKA